MSLSVQESKRSLQQIKSKVLDEVLDSELSELTHLKWLIHSALKIALMVGRDFFQNLVKLQAMALAFKTLLSIAPLLAVVFSILKGFGVHNRMEPALAEALAPLGEKGQEITAHLIGFVDKMRAGALGSIGLVTLFITVVSLMATIEESFNHIWRVTAPRKLARKFSDYLSAILVGPVLVFVAVTITATLQNNAIVHALLSLRSPRHGHSGVASAGAVSDSLGRVHFRLRFHPEHARQDSLSSGRRPDGSDSLATGGLGVRQVRRVFHALLCDLFELCDFVAVSPLAAHRLGDRAARRAGSLRASTYHFFQGDREYWRRAQRGAKNWRCT